jgi:hypothetical protein
MNEKSDPIPDEKGCYLNSSWHQCCCQCRFHIPDFYHCGVSRPEDMEKGCVCLILKGWICLCLIDENDVRAYSGWPEHDIGCELFLREKTDRFRILKGLLPKKGIYFKSNI